MVPIAYLISYRVRRTDFHIRTTAILMFKIVVRGFLLDTKCKDLVDKYSIDCYCNKSCRSIVVKVP